MEFKLARRNLSGGNRLTGSIGALTFGLAGLLAASGEMALGGNKPSIQGVKVGPIVVEARPIKAFDREDPERARFGKLTWRGGLILTSPSPHFGGWSGIALDTAGKTFLAVSDAGTWMTGTLVYDGGRPASMTSVRLGPLQALSGRTLARFRDRDAEGVALVKGAAKSHVLISFERNHRIGRFELDGRGLLAPSSYVALPAGTKRMSANGGLEAITVLKAGPYKGSLVAIAEKLRNRSRDHTGWLWVDGRPRVFHLSDGGYDITDSAALPGGGLLVLERYFRWGDGLKIRLRLIRAEELRPGARITGTTLLEANLSQEIDNMEGLAVHRGASGEMIVTMISDDNFKHGLQRTILLQFALSGTDLARANAQQ